MCGVRASDVGVLPVHGFVLAGGKSTRMGQDKALLRLGGRSMVEIAVEKLREFCAEVWIAGSREDLSGYAPVVKDLRADCGPVAGIEAGLRATTEDWAMFVPVDVPLVPAELLRRWAAAVMERGARASYLRSGAEVHPAVCMVHRTCLPLFSAALDSGEYTLSRILGSIGDDLWIADAAEFAAGEASSAGWFSNLNTPEDLARVDAILNREGQRA